MAIQNAKQVKVPGTRLSVKIENARGYGWRITLAGSGQELYLHAEEWQRVRDTIDNLYREAGVLE
ncbi:MAG TPA: hypothetical protein GXZ96_03885 [Firmicutes bacterium]|jgi:hypothetical protein|nr:hypothetical protein [Bacillota bacterium]